MSDRVLFLDFDGVLNSAAFAATKIPGVVNLDPDAVLTINEIVDRCDCEVVVTSSWRTNQTRDELQLTLEHVGFRGRVLGVTPDLSPRWKNGAIVREGRRRGEEILTWLRKMRSRLNVTHFAILDDDGESELGSMTPYLVQTNPETGITQTDAERVVTLLGGRT